MNKTDILRQFKGTFIAKKFDTGCIEAHDYAKVHGFDTSDLELIVNYSIQQKLSSTRISNLMKILIPETYMPDSVINVVLKWLLENYQKGIGKIALKGIFHWLIGLHENKLTESDIINLHYNFFYWFLKFDDPLAAKLIYLLTKPADVNRWQVKKVMALHTNYRSKTTGALLYLFKTYRPDCVPENIPAYAAQTVFPKLPQYFVEGFSNAKERIHNINEIPSHNDTYVWDRPNTYKIKANDVILIPKTVVVDENFNINSAEYTSLKKITNVKQLHKYMLKNYSLENMYLMPLLNNFAGRFIISYADDKIHSILSFMIFHILHDGFNNPSVRYEEMNYFLKCISSLQLEASQNIPVVTEFLKTYLITWDGDDHYEEILKLLEFTTENSFSELYEFYLKHLELLFISGSIYKKCDILNTLGNMILNIMLLKSSEGKRIAPIMFPNSDKTLNYNELLTHLSEFTRNLCYLGLILEKSHCLLQHCITNLYLKLISTEYNITWTIPDDILYSSLINCYPSNTVKNVQIIRRFKNAVSDKLIEAYRYIISGQGTFSLKDFSVNELNIINNLGLSIKNLCVIHHLSFSCYFLPFKLHKKCTPGFIKIMDSLTSLVEDDTRLPNKKRRRAI